PPIRPPLPLTLQLTAPTAGLSVALVPCTQGALVHVAELNVVLPVDSELGYVRVRRLLLGEVRYGAILKVLRGRRRYRDAGGQRQQQEQAHQPTQDYGQGLDRAQHALPPSRLLRFSVP